MIVTCVTRGCNVSRYLADCNASNWCLMFRYTSHIAQSNMEAREVMNNKSLPTSVQAATLDLEASDALNRKNLRLHLTPDTWHNRLNNLQGVPKKVSKKTSILTYSLLWFIIFNFVGLSGSESFVWCIIYQIWTSVGKITIFFWRYICFAGWQYKLGYSKK